MILKASERQRIQARCVGLHTEEDRAKFFRWLEKLMTNEIAPEREERFSTALGDEIASICMAAQTIPLGQNHR